MLNEFRRSGAAFFDPNEFLEVYLIAQHFGMPTRLLDWTTNPLAGLFFAVQDGETKNQAEVIVMDAVEVLPDDRHDQSKKLPRNVLGVRNPYALDAIGEVFWQGMRESRRPIILPVQPNNIPGRMGQQSSCFTLHMHKSDNRTNKKVLRVLVAGKAKPQLIDELHRLNINQFTIYNDLDHLSLTIRSAWDIKKSS